VARVKDSVAFRARALPAQSEGGGIGRGAEPPSEKEWVLLNPGPANTTAIGGAFRGRLLSIPSYTKEPV